MDLHILSAEERAHVESFRIPVDSEHPGPYWVLNLAGQSEMPKDWELLALRDYTEYKVRRFFNPGYADKLLAMAFARGDYNTISVRKGRVNGEEPESWFYRRSNWDHGMVPFTRTQAGERDSDYRPLGLLGLLDRMETGAGEVSPAWQAWKQDHPAIYGPSGVFVRAQEAIRTGDTAALERLLESGAQELAEQMEASVRSLV